jgi:hypothetical protein
MQLKILKQVVSDYTEGCTDPELLVEVLAVYTRVTVEPVEIDIARSPKGLPRKSAKERAEIAERMRKVWVERKARDAASK